MSAHPYRTADVTIEELEQRKKLIDVETDRAKARKWNEDMLRDIGKLRAQLAAGKRSRSSQTRAVALLIEIVCSKTIAEMEADTQRRLTLLTEEA